MSILPPSYEQDICNHWDQPPSYFNTFNSRKKESPSYFAILHARKTEPFTTFSSFPDVVNVMNLPSDIKVTIELPQSNKQKKTLRIVKAITSNRPVNFIMVDLIAQFDYSTKYGLHALLDSDNKEMKAGLDKLNNLISSSPMVQKYQSFADYSLITSNDGKRTYPPLLHFSPSSKNAVCVDVYEKRHNFLEIKRNTRFNIIFSISALFSHKGIWKCSLITRDIQVTHFGEVDDFSFFTF